MADKLPADHWIKQLQLLPHAEGGYYKEVYRSALSFPQHHLPAAFTGPRNACTHIYFLLEKKQFSAFHRIQSDELWHFYTGDPLIVYEINDTDGTLREHLLGNDLQAGQSFYCMIKAGNWFAAKMADNSEYALAGCTVSPGFDFKDFELAQKDELLKKYPRHEEQIRSLTLR